MDITTPAAAPATTTVKMIRRSSVPRRERKGSRRQQIDAAVRLSIGAHR